MSYTSDEIMTITAAHALRDQMICFVGIGLPSEAANLARATHAPNLVLIYESGTIGAKPDRLPLSIGDGILAETADAVISVPEIFNYWLQPGRIDVVAAQPLRDRRWKLARAVAPGVDDGAPRGRGDDGGGRVERRRRGHDVARHHAFLEGGAFALAPHT